MESNPRPPISPVTLGGTSPLIALHEWVAEGVVDEAARSRTRQRWLERQAKESATLAGILSDLAERDCPVMLTTHGGQQIRGSVTAIGADFVVIGETRRGDVFIPLGRLAVVRSAPGEESPTGDRLANFTMVLAAALVELAPQRPEVVVSVGASQIRGELRSAGADVVAVSLDGPRREVVHVAVAAIDHLVIVGR